MNKNIILTIAIATSLVLGFVGATKKSTEIQTGAVSSPYLQSQDFSYGGVLHFGAKTDSLTQATTTVCALQSPSATSTLLHASIRFSVSSTTASTVTLAKASTPYATTTSLGAVSLAANAQGIAVASTTGSHIFSPNTYFVVGMAGNGANTYSPTGTCQATWIVN